MVTLTLSDIQFTSTFNYALCGGTCSILYPLGRCLSIAIVLIMYYCHIVLFYLCHGITK